VATGENSFEVAAGGPGHFVQMTSGPEWAWTSLRGRRTYSTPAIGFVPRTNGGWILIRGTDNTLWGKGPQVLANVKWQRISSKLITGAPTAAGTRQPAPHIIAVVRDTNRAPWTATSAGSDWSAFTRPWIPQG
jgi:hypothetical protein